MTKEALGVTHPGLSCFQRTPHYPWRWTGMNVETEEHMDQDRPLAIPIRIVGKVYTWASVRAPFDTDQVGECDPKQLTITVRHDVAPQQQAETTLHEILEAINSEMYLEMDEGQISRLSVALFGVLKDNPHLVEFLEKLQWPYHPEWHIKARRLDRSWDQVG